MAAVLKFLDGSIDLNKFVGTGSLDFDKNATETGLDLYNKSMVKGLERDCKVISFFGGNSKMKPTSIRRLHIGTNQRLSKEEVIEYLNGLRGKKKYLTEGTILMILSRVAIVIKCDPTGGYLAEDTIVYVEESIKPLESIFLLWNLKDYNILKKEISKFFKDPDEIVQDLLSKRIYYGPFRVSRSSFGNHVRHLLNLKLGLRDNMMPDGKNSVPDEEDKADSTNRSGTEYMSYEGNGLLSDTDGWEDYDLFLFQEDDTGYSILTDPNDRIYRLFEKIFKKYLKRLLETPRFFFIGNNQLVGDYSFFVSCMVPVNKPGYIDTETEIYFGFDPFENFDQVTVSPLRDTLPINYRYNLLEDCVKPFFRLNSFKVFRLGDVFNSAGIQFRITDLSKNNMSSGMYFNFSKILTCPKYGRINSNTQITIGKPVSPKLMDLLPSERIEILRRSAPCYREKLLMQFAADMDVNSLDRVYQTNHGNSTTNSHGASVNPSNNQSLDNSLSHPADNELVEPTNPSSRMSSARSERSEPTSRSDETSVERNARTCTVCCERIDLNVDTSNLVFLSCGHVFHRRCVSTWILMKRSCPNCRTTLTDQLSGLPSRTISNISTGINSTTTWGDYRETLRAEAHSIATSSTQLTIVPNSTPMSTDARSTQLAVSARSNQSHPDHLNVDDLRISQVYEDSFTREQDLDTMYSSDISSPRTEYFCNSFSNQDSTAETIHMTRDPLDDPLFSDPAESEDDRFIDELLATVRNRVQTHSV